MSLLEKRWINIGLVKNLQVNIVFKEKVGIFVSGTTYISVVDLVMATVRVTRNRIVPNGRSFVLKPKSPATGSEPV